MTRSPGWPKRWHALAARHGWAMISPPALPAPWPRPLPEFMAEAAELQLEAGVIRQKPALGPMLDTSFIG